MHVTIFYSLCFCFCFSLFVCGKTQTESNPGFGSIINSDSSSKIDPEDLQERFARIENNLPERRQIEGNLLPAKSVHARMEEYGVPGLSVAIAINGKVEFTKGYGFADLEQQTKVTPNTLFQSASISKPIVALRVLQLAEQGKIDLDTDVNQYLSQWQLHYNVYTKDERVTARRLMNHTAAITGNSEGFQRGQPLPTTLDLLYGRGTNVSAIRVLGVPGRHWLYANGGYTVLQYLLEEVDQQPFPQLMYRHVLIPMGMTGSVFSHPLPEEYHQRAATGYMKYNEPVQGKWLNLGQLASGGLWSTPTDLLQYAIHIQNIRNGKLSAHQSIINKQSVKQMLTPYKNNQGLGPVVNEHTFEHNGSSQGYRSLIVGWLEHDVAIAVLTNLYDHTILYQFVHAVAEEFNLPGYDTQVYKSIALSNAEKQKFAGTYNIAQLGKVTFEVTEEGLLGIPEFFDTSYRLFPQTPSQFVNIYTGTKFHFLFDDTGTNVVGFETSMAKATKVSH